MQIHACAIVKRIYGFPISEWREGCQSANEVARRRSRASYRV